MARKRNRPSKAERRAKQKREEQKLVAEMAAAIDETAQRFTCTTGIAHDFAEQCERRADDLEFDLSRSRLALEMWGPVPSDAARPMVEMLRELLAERERHQQALDDFCERFYEYARLEIHEHLEPMEKYAELIFTRLFGASLDVELDAQQLSES